MKRTSGQKLRLGIFVILGTALFIAAVYLIGQREYMFRSTFTISSYFQNVNGLQRGNNVRYSGIDIGTVKAISMINDSTIQVDMSIQDRITSHIRKNAIATIGSDGLVGNMIVNIVPGKGTAALISDGDVIESFSKIGADDILSTLSVGSENAAILTNDLLTVTEKMLEGEGTLGMLLNDTLVAQNLKQTIYNLKTASSGASRTINELNEIVSALKTEDESVLGMILNDTVSGQKLKNIVSNLETTSNEIQNVLSGIQQVVDDFNSGEGAYRYLTQDTAMVRSLEVTIKNVEQASARFNENMMALRSNWLFRGYFKKQEREAKKAARKQENDKEIP